MLVENYPVFMCLLKSSPLQSKTRGKITLTRKTESAKHDDIAVNKWKTPIQNCITLETLKGNVAKPAEKDCDECDVVSTRADGSAAYIVAKSVGVLGDSFTLSESEYAAARRYGDNYLVYLFTTATSDIKYVVLKNPASTVNLKKVVRIWEWRCDSYPISVTATQDARNQSTVHEQKIGFPTDFDGMTGVQFEEFCAQLLIKNGYEEVTLTPGSGDQGIDIIAYRDGVRYGIQCKCYSADIGNSAVQEVFAGRSYYKCHVGIVLTNRHFSPSAIQLAETNGIVLWSRDVLLRMIRTAGLS